MNKKITILGCIAAAMLLASVASAASNQLWTNGGNNQLFGDVANWTSDVVPQPGLADSDVLYINTSDEATCPVISAAANGIYPYTVAAIHVGETFGSSTGPGLLKQTGGTQSLSGALVVGSGVLAGNPVSKFIMSGGTLDKTGSGGDPVIGGGGGYGEVEIGTGATLNFYANWAWVGKDAGSQGTLKMTGGTMTAYESLRIGAVSGNGALSMTNGSSLTVYQDISIAAYESGTGSMSVTDSTVAVYGNLRVGTYVTTPTTATLSGTTTITVSNSNGESQFGQGAHLDLNMRDSAVLDVGGLVETPAAQPINFGSWGGGTIDIDMTGESKIFAKSSNGDGDAIRLGRNGGGTSTLTMTDDAEFNVTGQLDAGRNAGGLDVELHKRAKIDVQGFVRMNCDGAVGNITLGTLDATDEDASITITRTGGDALDTGSWGGQSTWKMYAQTHLQVNGTAILGAGENGYCSFEAYNGATIDVTTDMLIGGGYGGSQGILTLNNTTDLSVTGGLTIGDNVVGKLTTNDSATVSAEKIQVGMWAGNGELKANGGTVTTNSDLLVGFNWGSSVDDQGTHSMNAAGATVSIGGELLLGADGGKGTYTQGSGHTTVAVAVILGEGDYSDSIANRVGSHGDGILNLNGGTITAPRLTTQSQVVSTWEVTDPADPNYPGDKGTLLHMVAHGVVNFNGGVLEASAASTDFIATDDPLASVTLNVLEGGAKIDSNGNAITITKALAGDAAARSLQVLNSDAAPGVLTLTGAVTNIGPVSIDSGATLQMNNGTTTFTAVSGGGSLKVVGGSTLYADSISLDTLIIGGTATAASVAAVPEPGTLTLLSLAGLLSIGAYMRRR